MSAHSLTDWISDVIDEHGFDHPDRLGIDRIEWVRMVCAEHGFDVPEDLIAAQELHAGYPVEVCDLDGRMPSEHRPA